ncbi:ATP-binding protein [Janthinobacterium sp. FW305-128]|uniref:ATP-binding protein n=1 Tax=Janthinobacterium sp. FW305-128 TaxID=2775055 RepID=UPI001E6213E9|nr:ATP-binding protein [Janthinobacterium sp. FW305-128]MCC7682743.1 ATP-binding protein [Janthinobacterium sp. FW305-128]
MTLRKKAVKAEYIESEIPEWVGNEFIECLGPPPSAEKLAKIMSYKPPYEEAERLRPPAIRKQLLKRLERAYVPLTAQQNIADTLGQMIRSGYEHRAPSKPEFNQYLQTAYEAQVRGECIESAPELEPLCESFAIIGISGVGKSRLVHRALAQFPRLVWHPEIRRFSIPYIVVECPHNGTVKQLILNFFERLDKVLGTKYELKFTRARLPVEALIREVNTKAHLYGVGLIVIDEIQHVLAAPTENGKTLFMNFIVRFVNESVAPIVLIGTMSSLKLMQQDFRIARRTMGAFLKNYQKGREWDHFLKKIWRYQWTKNESLLTPKINEAMYQRTQGVLALAVKLYRAAQRRAIDSGVEEVTEELIHVVADDEFGRVAPMLKALASGDAVKLMKYGDLYIPTNSNKRPPKADKTNPTATGVAAPKSLLALMDEIMPSPETTAPA